MGRDNEGMNLLSRLRRLWPFRALGSLLRHHLLGGTLLIAFTAGVLAHQVTDREAFASSELATGVQERWGAPVVQPAPSLRFVQSGTVFTELKPLAFDRQHVRVDAEMSYRKRGLRYFSGFDFALNAEYAVQNREAYDIDVAFVFPIEVNKSQVLLSELRFQVNGVAERLDLGASGDRLLWTGRIPAGKAGSFHIRYRARGLDSFVYKLDPALPARDLWLHVGVKGGENYDYPAGILAASSAVTTGDSVALDWKYAALESGVSLGLILPSERTYDALIATMAARGWAPGLAFLLVLALLGVRNGRKLAPYESYLLAALFAFFFVLLAYVAAFLDFYVSYVLCLWGLGAAACLYARRLFPRERWQLLVGLWVATAGVPTAAVICEGYTGLLNTLELLAILLGLMALSTRAGVRAFLSEVP